MAKKRYKEISLTQATKILRAHSTQITPPGLLEFKNAYLSRSDNSIGLRSDLEPAYDGMFSYSNLIQSADQEDYLSAAFYVDRAGHTIWFGRWCPFTWDGSFSQLFTIYSDGTITTDGVRTEVLGTGTAWMQQIWPGCLLRIGGEGGLIYPIRFVTSDQRLVTEEPVTPIAGSEYEIFRVHPAVRADWPIKMESLGGFLIYNTVDIAQPVDPNYISGPFYSNIGRPNLGVWFGTDPDVDESAVQINGVYVNGRGGSGGTLQLDAAMNPYLIISDLGLMAGRVWFGDSPVVKPSYARGGVIATHPMSAGTLSSLTYIDSNSVLTLSGQIIEQGGTVIEPTTDMGGNFEQRGLSDGASLVEQPFGDVPLFGKCGELFLGANGLLGKADGTTYSTSVTVALRSGWAWNAGYDQATTYYVAVGDADSTDGVILYFTDPSSISRATTGITESFTSVIASPFLDRAVAVGEGGVCMTSDDHGATWTPRTIGTTANLKSIASDKQGRCFCVVGDADGGVAQCFVSMDGINWDQVTGLGSDDLVGVDFSDFDGCFVVAAAGGKLYLVRRRIQFSGVGASVVGTIDEIGQFVCDVQHDGTQFVAVGSKIWTSPDAINWTERADPAVGTLFSVAKDVIGGNNWVAVGTGGQIWRSTNDAVTWSIVSSPVTTDLVKIVCTDIWGIHAGSFVAVGDGGKVIKSANGASWVIQPFPVTDNIAALAFDGTNCTANQRNLYAITESGDIYVNTAGITGSFKNWTLWDSRPDNSYRDSNLPNDLGIYNRILQTFRQTMTTSRSAIAVRYENPFQLFLAPHVNIAISNCDVNNPNAIAVQGDVNVSEYYNPSFTGDWGLTWSSFAANALCAIGRDDFAPIIVRRLYHFYVGSQGFSIPMADAIVTSTDGVTWSTQPTQFYSPDGYYPYRLGQALAPGTYRECVLTPGAYWLPICSDGDYVYVIQSMNGKYGAVPRVVKSGGLELVTYVEELE